MFSPQNVDRLVTIYRACLRAGRDLVIDLYTAAVAADTGRDTIPQADWERVRVYLPRSQKAKVIREQAFERTDVVKPRRIYAEELAARRGELMMLFRQSMGRELEAIGCLEAACAVWSMWPGYLRQPSGARLKEWLDRLRIPMTIHHASGNAYIADLQRLVRGRCAGPRRADPQRGWRSVRRVLLERRAPEGCRMVGRVTEQTVDDVVRQVRDALTPEKLAQLDEIAERMVDGEAQFRAFLLRSEADRLPRST